MGLFSRIVDYVTGQSAQVEVDIQNATLSNPFQINISAQILKNSIECEKVYLLVRCLEKKLDTFKPLDPKNLTDNEKILKEMREWNTDTLYKSEIQVAPGAKLEASKQYNWSVQVDLSANTLASLDTDNHKVIWEVQAGLDTPGNDPDSGWVSFDVKP